MENQTVAEGKTIAIISYLTIIGTVIAYLMNMNKKNAFANFHIRQMIGIFILGMLNKYVIYDVIGSFFGWACGVLVFILWIVGFFGAIQGEEKKSPIFGEYFQEWFKSI
ncbi:MAG: DUF4870 domain-containing protein [Flavobacteriaceae bacterium]